MFYRAPNLLDDQVDSTAQFLHYKQKRGSSLSSSPAAGAEQIGRVAGASENPIA